MVLIVFRIRLRAGIDDRALEALGLRMQDLAASMPGFISYKEFASGDGEYLSLVEFDSPDNLAAWREHPEHLEAQRLGREIYFSNYRIQVCAPLREYGFPD